MDCNIKRLTLEWSSKLGQHVLNSKLSCCNICPQVEDCHTQINDTLINVLNIDSNQWNEKICNWIDINWITKSLSKNNN